tara:strand:+ start:1537 stop:2025 length:489 start_codon:yes stop_codon:yes gene_type:complete
MSSKKITVIDNTLWCNITGEYKELNINLSYLLNIKRVFKKQNKKKSETNKEKNARRSYANQQFSNVLKNFLVMYGKGDHIVFVDLKNITVSQFQKDMNYIKELIKDSQNWDFDFAKKVIIKNPPFFLETIWKVIFSCLSDEIKNVTYIESSNKPYISTIDHC